MLRPQKLAKEPLKAFKDKGEKCRIWGGGTFGHLYGQIHPQHPLLSTDTYIQNVLSTKLKCTFSMSLPSAAT
ncbi:hypothetical protein EKN49_15220 [Enterobacter roggenkampii]|nr:hypothetical protein EKN49_15220 [Enterobacter roggenkampii]